MLKQTDRGTSSLLSTRSNTTPLIFHAKPPANPTTANAPAHHLYYVLAADMAFYNAHEMTIEGCQMVLASAEDEYEACDVARNALEEGVLPIAAYNREDLLKMADELLHHSPLPPGKSYNLAHQKTDEEMAELRVDARIE